MKRKMLLMFAVIVALNFCLVSPSMAQAYKTIFVPLGPGVPGVLYEPVTPGAKSEIAVIAMHTGADYLTFPPCLELAKRGYRALCANCSTSKSGFISDDNEDKMILNVKLAVAYLRKYSGIKKIILLGHSGGGALMSRHSGESASSRRTYVDRFKYWWRSNAIVQSGSGHCQRGKWAGFKSRPGHV
jgi:hypothetical protein